jgi:hypothetical protein
MKCPLFSIAPEINSSWVDCLEEQCAWWEEVEERCAIMSITVDMDRAVSVVNDLCLTLAAQLGNLNENLIKR